MAANAIKHGIFTKDLILKSDIIQEKEEEYREILGNLIDCLSPCNQLEGLLVEKIAVDFWRLRRIIRFETGSIEKAIKSLIKDFYLFGEQDNEQIDRSILHKQRFITWNISFIECLAKGEVTFDQKEWKGKDLTSDIVEDFYLLAKSITTLSKAEKERLYSTNGLSFDEIRALLQKYGYVQDKEISSKLIELYSKQNQDLEEEIQKLRKQKIENDDSNKLLYMLGMVPTTENTDKILKYERSLQKSIFQNLIMLKKLQGLL